MQSPSLSAQEQSFINQHGQRIDKVAADLTNLYHEMSRLDYSHLKTSSDEIISYIRPVATFTQDVECDLRALFYQMLDLIYYRLPAPIANFEGEPVPVLLTVAERCHFDGSLASLNFQASAGYSLGDPQQAMRAVSGPLTKFLASRMAHMAHTPTASVPTRSNLTVSNTANGWTIVYTPCYLTTENGFGGPSTPVNGHLNPGKYRFGIKKTGPAQWDTTSWSIPPTTNIHIPLP
jgi:hypothetical protein